MELLILAAGSLGLFGAIRHFARRVSQPYPPARRVYIQYPPPYDEPDWARAARHLRLDGITVEDVRRMKQEGWI
jgi:hypothetical protein